MSSIPISALFRPQAAFMAGTAALALAIFVADVFTPPDCVVSGFYVVVVLMAGRFCSNRGLWLVAAGAAVLTLLAQVLSHRVAERSADVLFIGVFNTSVSLLAVFLSCYLVLRGRAAETRLRRAQADLARMVRVSLMGELTASIAHEVNQPIAGVVANAGACVRWLSAEEPDLEEAKAALGRIVRDGNRAADIIRRIRAIFARGETEKQTFDFNGLIRETAELLRTEAARNGITLRLELDPSGARIQADRVQLQQVIVNLVMNAFEAVQAVDGPREVTLAAGGREGTALMVSVSDTGVGLPPERDRLFEAFVSTKPQGTGLGLSISRSIIESHGGELWAQANQPRGARFSFSLPADASGYTKV